MKVGIAACLFAVWMFMAQAAQAYTFRQVGVDTNILVADGKVYFAQADGSFTALDLATGKVLLRKATEGGSGGLALTKYGILITGGHRAELVDKDTFESIWKSMRCHGSFPSGEFVVLKTCSGSFECRELRTGRLTWSYVPSSRSDDVVAAKGRILLKSEPAEDGRLTLTVLDVASGRELLKKRTPAEIPCQQAYFDGESIYLAIGYMPAEDLAGRLDKMLVWDLSGMEIGSIEPPVALRSSDVSWSRPFEIEGKVFHRGHVRHVAKMTSPSTSQAASRPEDDSIPAPSEAKIATGRTGQPGERLLPTVTVELAAVTWRGFLPYATGGEISTFAQADGKLLLGTSTGQVECVDIRTGRSLWIYVFAAVNQTVSYSSPHGMPPYLADQAKAFHNRKALPAPKGLCLLPTGKTFEDVDLAELVAKMPSAAGPAVVFDPQPVDLYAELPLYLAKAWTGVLAPTAVFGVILLLSRRRRWGWRVGVFAGLLAAGVITADMYYYGRVSGQCTLMAKLLIVGLAMLTGYYSFKAVKEHRWVTALAAIGGLAALGYFALPMIRYA